MEWGERAMRLALVISSLRGGGAERVMTHLANGWAARGQDVDLITFDHDGPTTFPLDPRVCRTDVLPASSIIPPVRVWDRVLGLRKELRARQPDVVLSFGDRTNVQSILAARALKIPVLISERSNPDMMPLSQSWSVLRRWSYPSAQMLVAQTESVRKWAHKRFEGLSTRVIPNPVVVDTADALHDQPVIVAAGRLGPEKGFDVLLRAFAAVAADYPDWTLRILGDGPERATLEGLVTNLGLQGRVQFPGFQEDVGQHLASAGVFVLSSRFEGFPNVLIEAMAHGTAVIATRCRSGPSDIVRDGLDGRLVAVDDATAMANALHELLSSPSERIRLGTAAEAVRERFRLTHVLDLWEEAIGECTACRAASPSRRQAA
jgi:GalNAc-alpha-(1->4)-GalNAc-alpha-(1->3)-diNAcBac-PP-undecaprenol alpha-1,4-N-acetyl-D-galactosaminyltransferase